MNEMNYLLLIQLHYRKTTPFELYNWYLIFKKELQMSKQNDN